MSEDKVRYFQGSRTGYVVRAGDEEAALAFDLNPAMAKVQVVPLDAIVIRRDELPEVDATRGARVNSVGIGWALDYLTADREEKARSYGLAYLALAEYLREHPPVDEAQVKALKDLRDEWYKRNDSSDLLEFLASRGVRVGDA